MRCPAAAALCPRLSPPTGTQPLSYRLFSSLVEDQELVKMLYQENLATLDRVKEHRAFMRSCIAFFEKGNKCMSWFFKLLMPIHVTTVTLEVITT